MLLRVAKSVSGLLLLMAMLLGSMVGGVAHAQTGTTTPGTPNTGAGGDSSTVLLLLGASAFVLIAGGIYLTRRFTSSS